jgi:short subunit dehydrogenase-like uncharacterized protein
VADARATTSPIVVYGASGYTGRLICAELARRGAEFVLAGRNRERLEAAAAGLAGEHEIAAVPLDDGPGLRELLGRAAAVIGCAGPFTLHGEPLIAAAAETGTNYLDTTGEQPFIRAAFERWGAPAERSGAALVSGFGFDYVPGDMLAALTARDLGPLEELRLAYSIRGFGPTQGTALSALEMMQGGDVVWRDGELVTASRHVGMGSFEFPSPIGCRGVGRYPSGETVTVPRHVDVRNVEVVVDLRALTGMRLGPLAAPAMTAGGLLMGTPARGLAGKLIRRLPEGPDERARKAARYTIVCLARHSGGERRGVLRGSDVYGITAVSLAEGAIRMADPAYDRTGALAPSQAFDPEVFLRCLEPFGVSVEIEPVGA